MAKYAMLNRFLNDVPEQVNSICLSFNNIEQILNITLPDSARDHFQWWGNEKETTTRPQAEAWMDAGFKAKVDLNTLSVRFDRIK